MLMKEITSAKLSYARNAEHIQYIRDLLEIITADFATNHKIGTLRAALLSLFNQEDAAYATAQALEDTAEIEALDLKRDDLTRFVCMTIEACCYSPEADKKAAAQSLKLNLKPYWGAQSNAYYENTGKVSSMVSDMTDKYGTETGLLGLTDAVKKLGEANEAFNTAYGARSEVKQTKRDADKLKELRPQVDTAYRSLVKAIDALYQADLITAESAGTDADATLAAAIDKINARAAQLNETVNARSTCTASKAKDE